MEFQKLQGLLWVTDYMTGSRWWGGTQGTEFSEPQESYTPHEGSRSVPCTAAITHPGDPVPTPTTPLCPIFCGGAGLRLTEGKTTK